MGEGRGGCPQIRSCFCTRPQPGWFWRDHAHDHSANAEGDPCDEVVAEAVLEAVENFLAAVADDFREPHAAIDRDEQSALVEPGRMGMSGDVRIDEMIPDANDFGFCAASV